MSSPLAQRRPAARPEWLGWVATCLGIGGAAMLIWPIPAPVQLVGQTADSVVFLAECAVLTLAVGLEASEAAGGRRLGSVGRFWLNATMQLAGTLAALASINAGSAFGALCFVIGLVLLWRHQLQRVRPPVPKEV